VKLSLNLATRSYLNRRAIYFSLLGVAGFLLGLLALHGYDYFRSRNRIVQLEERLTELEAKTEKVRGTAPPKLDAQEQKQLTADIEFANQTLKKDSFRWTALLDHLEKLVPPGVAVRGIRPDFQTGAVNLTAAAVGVKELQSFLDNLIGSPDFHDVYLLQQARQEARTGGALLNFSVVVKGAF